jgi:hypothetical protein
LTATYSSCSRIWIIHHRPTWGQELLQATDFWQKNNTLQTLVKDNACVVCEFNGNNMSNRIETSLNDELLSEMFGNDEIKLIEEK